ncbi:hypothetical protein TWF730_006042 [Orbilia blumenaviensis]|uniref:Peptidase S8/S53 domain-containing protein n=1 Tax=Orbilia blumenaviensis TaxID=1796055 RepID=A0AAV9VL96_9PEZI
MAMLERLSAAGDIDSPVSEDVIQWVVLVQPGFHKHDQTDKMLFEIKALDNSPTYFEGGDPMLGYWWFSFSATEKALAELIARRRTVIASWKPLVDTYDYRELETVLRRPRRNMLKRSIIQKSKVSARELGVGALRTELPMTCEQYHYQGGYGHIQHQPDAGGKNVTDSIKSRGPKRSRPFPPPQNIFRDYSWGHGTAIMSKILGGTVGIARSPWRTTVVVNCDKNGKTSRIHILDSLYKIWADVDALKRTYRGKSIIVSMSSGFFYDSGRDEEHTRDPETFDGSFREIMLEMMEEMGKLGIKFVIPVGSGKESKNEETYYDSNPVMLFPANVGLTLKHKEYIMVVGGVDMAHWLNSYQTDRRMEIWAPAKGIKVALTASKFNELEVSPVQDRFNYGFVDGPCYGVLFYPFR